MIFFGRMTVARQSAMGSKITIELPDSLEEQREVILFLRKKGVLFDKEAPATERKEEKPARKSRWARAAERLKSEGFLRGQGEEVKKWQREFRKGFSL